MKSSASRAAASAPPCAAVRDRARLSVIARGNLPELNTVEIIPDYTVLYYLIIASTNPDSPVAADRGGGNRARATIAPARRRRRRRRE